MPRERKGVARPTPRPTPDAQPQAAPAPYCDRCDNHGLIPIWRYDKDRRSEDGFLVSQSAARCSCVHGAHYSMLKHIDSIHGIPRGLNHHQMNLIISAVVAHPNLTPLEAIGFLPRSREQVLALFRRLQVSSGSSLAARITDRLPNDDALERSWRQIRDALLESLEDAERGYEPEF